MTHNLSKEKILRGHKAFSGVIARGSSLTSGSIRLFYVPTKSPDPAKAGFTVSRSIRKATVRNRIKRCLRESYRQHEGIVPRGIETIIFMYRGEGTPRASQARCKTIGKDLVLSLEKLSQRLSS